MAADKPVLVYAGHSYHQLTSSTQFLLDLLAQHYRISVVWDEGWKLGGEPLRAQQINDLKPKIVLFFQTLPTPFELRQIRCKRLFIVPMHDSVVGNPQDIWSIVRPSGLRAINFCRHTHAFFVGLGYESLCVQYWPQARVQSVGTTNGLQVFMWMRKKEIGWSVLKALLGTARPARILLRVAADPGESLELPSPEDIQEYNIEVITGWLEKTRYMELLTACDIFVAPRLNEGIGQSFLEAMSYGMAVIAPDSPTMNEYIRHGHNGYLYAPTAPQPLDFSKLGTIREQALRDVTAGHIAWQAQQSAVLKCLSSRARKGPGFRWRLDGFFGR